MLQNKNLRGTQASYEDERVRPTLPYGSGTVKYAVRFSGADHSAVQYRQGSTGERISWFSPDFRAVSAAQDKVIDW